MELWSTIVIHKPILHHWIRRIWISKRCGNSDRLFKRSRSPSIDAIITHIPSERYWESRARDSAAAISFPFIPQDDSHEPRHKYAKAISAASYQYIITAPRCAVRDVSDAWANSGRRKKILSTPSQVPPEPPFSLHVCVWGPALHR